MRILKKSLTGMVITSFVLASFNSPALDAQSAMVNVMARHCYSLNGKWQAIIDPAQCGDWRRVWKDPVPQKKTDFFEYSFDGGPVLNVPGDFNSQLPELKYYEGVVWYRKDFQHSTAKNHRLFLHFGAVNYLATVYLNGELLGSHEGGFTPFQFEITGKVRDGSNSLVVKVDNHRQKNGIPALGYDWLNYGGITRDVNLVETPVSYIEDYSIQLKKNSRDEVKGWVKVEGATDGQEVQVQIPELKVNYTARTNAEGIAAVDFKAKFVLWNPGNPKLYKVTVQCGEDTVADEIGFRTIEVKDAKILLNGKPVFLKGINMHEEMPLRAARSYSEADALAMLNWAKELGCNFVRLAHYPHNEYEVHLAEKMGLMVWEEIPVYQQIEFTAPGVPEKMKNMLTEAINRDRNRCGIIIWSISNETNPGAPGRNRELTRLAGECRQMDSTRLVSSAINSERYRNNVMDVWDSLYTVLDVMGVNEYNGWYVPWQGPARETKWELVCKDKPMIITEFGGEALFGNTDGPADAANSWNENYQAQIYRDQIEMFQHTPNLSGTCPWVLADFRSPIRLQPKYQDGWNRKGLLSDRGDKKKAWYIMKAFYQTIQNIY